MEFSDFGPLPENPKAKGGVPVGEVPEAFYGRFSHEGYDDQPYKRRVPPEAVLVFEDGQVVDVIDTRKGEDVA